jgi:F-type H+-transporting ATPase subunit delta
VSDAVSRRYAQALLELAVESNEVDAVGADLTRFVEVAATLDGQLANALRSPAFTAEERRRVLDLVIGRLQPRRITANFLRLVNDKRRMAIVPSIAEAYSALADQLAGRLKVVVQTAEPMSPELEQDVRAALQQMTGKVVLVRAEVRAELIGGLVARIGDRVYDSSIRTRLDDLRRSLLQSPIAQA